MLLSLSTISDLQGDALSGMVEVLNHHHSSPKEPPL